ncbi:MAG: rhodanese-like domain-containing protein [Thermodesulfobacteriota bacterium]|nr:rhodanese-like domain-containing protein [Thermodesulfobacteriota bacterium]
MKLYFPLVILTCLLFSGCAQYQGGVQQNGSTATGSKKVFRGKVTDRSDRTKSFSLEAVKKGSSRIIKLNFDDQTRGMDYVVKRKQVIVSYRIVAGSPLARSVKPEKTGLVAGVSEVPIEKIEKMIDHGDEFVLIDSRPKDEYIKSHLPTSISIPSCQLKNHAELLPEDKDQLLVFYCGGVACGMSRIASATAARFGYTNIKVMSDGVKGWAKAGFPTFAVDTFVLKGNFVLIDLRSAHKDTKERIPGSVSIPFATLKDRVKDISKKAPIVVYSDSIRESHAALAEFRAAGFTRVSMVQGNFQGWKKRKNPIVSGPVVTKISWKRRLGKGEVSRVAFTSAMNGKIDVVILDVRTSDEAAAGKLRRAKLIPIHELFDRREELPKDKRIYVYSATGARADMASRQLRENGYDAYFLVADVSCYDGKCMIEY